LALVETAAGLENATLIAAYPRTARLAFRSIDFALDVGTTDEDFEYARPRLVVVSRARRTAAPIDGVTTDLDDPARTASEAERARRLGFPGKVCLHPRQIDPINRAFRPPTPSRPGPGGWPRRPAAPPAGSTVR
jgi:citrate lyase subunit beta/citryl-CoA lyase